MIEICRLTKRQMDASKKDKMPHHLEQIKVFSLAVGHGIGTVDFVECIGILKDNEYEEMLNECGEYAAFKLGNISRYFEVEVFPEHARKLVQDMPTCFLKDEFLTLKEGYIVIRKADEKSTFSNR